MDLIIEELQRDAAQIERVLSGVNDDLSLRTLREYAAELDARISHTRFGNDK
jgi:hypothetical protein